MKIAECMSTDVRVAADDNTLQSAAQAMGDIDAGFLPVIDNGHLIGIVTDRDIAIRGVAAGLPPESGVRDVMSEDVLYCFDDQDSREVLANMSELQVRRLPVVNRDKRLVGIVSLSDLADEGDSAPAGEALEDIALPSSRHSQSV
ncbi:MAG: CBS domain-containing protein [Sphingomonadaceae bacterium]